MITRPLAFMIAMLYGVCWVMGPLNIYAAILTIGEGGTAMGFVPSIIGPFGVILYIHYRNGWIPFNRGAK